MPHDPTGELSRIRCRYMQTFLAAVDRLRPAAARQIRTAMGPRSLELIASTPALGWVSASHNLVATRAAYEVLGSADAYEFFRRMFAAQYDTALFRSFVQSITRLLGSDPGRYLKWVERGYSLAFRGLGRWETIERSETAAVARLIDVPDEFRTDGSWSQSVCGSLHSVLDVAHRQGEVTAVGEARGTDLAYRLVWR